MPLKIIQVIIIFLPVIISAQEEEIIFNSGGINLSGTLIKPKGPGPHPAAIFIHASGAEERSNSKSRAKEFAKNGVAAFIYDKRGVGKSEGNKDFQQYFSFETLAQDANAAAYILSKRSDIKADRIGFVAASQGGWVAPLAADTNRNIAFMIIISGSVSTPGEDNLFERNARLRKEGFIEDEIKQVTEMHIIDQEVSRSGKRFDEFEKLWEQYKNSRWFKRVYLSEAPSPPASRYREWYKTIVDFNPVPYLQKLTTPVLWLYGDADLDRFCPVELSVQRLNELKKNGKDYEIILVPGADHSLIKKSKDFVEDESVFAWLKKRL